MIFFITMIVKWFRNFCARSAVIKEKSIRSGGYIYISSGTDNSPLFEGKKSQKYFLFYKEILLPLSLRRPWIYRSPQTQFEQTTCCPLCDFCGDRDRETQN